MWPAEGRAGLCEAAVLSEIIKRTSLFAHPHRTSRIPLCGLIITLQTQVEPPHSLSNDYRENSTVCASVHHTALNTKQTDITQCVHGS